MKKFFLMAFFAAMLLSAASCSSPKEDTFTLWQLPSQVNTIGNSYVIQTVNGRVIVMDGGSKEETSYLRGFISALGAEVEAWFISHPHDDHFEALLEILRDPQDIKINRIYHSRFTPELIELEQGYWNAETKEIYGIFDNATDFEVFDCHAGDEFQIDGINFKILSEKNRRC